jgi:type III secretion protein U
LEKRFPASKKKLDDLRKKGQVPKSMDLTPSVVFASFTIAMFFAGAALLAQFTNWLEIGLQLAVRPFNTDTLMESLFKLVIFVILPAFLIGIVGTIVTFLTIGPVFAVEAITPKFERINPASGIKKLFSMQQVVMMLKSIIVVAAIMAVFILLLKYMMPSLSRVPYLPMTEGLKVIANFFFAALVVAAVVGIVAGLGEKTMSKAFFLKEQKMTREDMVREYKESEGDPHVKSQRKSLAREALENDEVRTTRDAELMIVNPTHIAIAVKGQRKFSNVPLVIAKGKGHLAARMREEAKKKGIPIVQNRDLARKLFVDAKVWTPIPRKYYQAVQQMLLWVRKMEEFKKQQKEIAKPSNRRRTRKSAKGAVAKGTVAKVSSSIRKT